MPKIPATPIPAWGVQSLLEYKRGYLTGAVLLDGLYSGFYPVPVILLDNDKKEQNAERITAYAVDIADKQRLIPRPKRLDYADLTIGIESAAVGELIRLVILPRDRKPAPLFYGRSSKFYAGVIAAAIDMAGTLNPVSINIYTRTNEHAADALFSVLSRLNIPAAKTSTGISVRGKNALANLLSWLPDSEISKEYNHLTAHAGTQE